MDAVIYRDGYKYSLHFEKGENVSGLIKEEADKKQSGTDIKWRPDTEVFTDINIPSEYFKDTLKRQAIVNAGLVFEYYDEESGEHETYVYENGIRDYIKGARRRQGLYRRMLSGKNETKGPRQGGQA